MKPKCKESLYAPSHCAARQALSGRHGSRRQNDSCCRRCKKLLQDPDDHQHSCEELTHVVGWVQGDIPTAAVGREEAAAVDFRIYQGIFRKYEFGMVLAELGA